MTDCFRSPEEPRKITPSLKSITVETPEVEGIHRRADGQTRRESRFPGCRPHCALSSAAFPPSVTSHRMLESNLAEGGKKTDVRYPGEKDQYA
ncbi:hypothetical protein RRG08_006738 [Elysia crispata]|uniref:Uncharacterized protein n=1 Tax=Elysia crispata TaxID=231223 RepID=A0AAE1AEF6_9GAST|nr:hypothetical protein RRG08_006738 [Elysia crispata]